jgi:hypothetical protein
MNINENLIKNRSTSQINTNHTTSRKITIRSPKAKKDAKELALIIKEKAKVDSIKAKLNEKRSEIERYKEEINQLFKKSNSKETELKNYIAGLNSKMMNVDITYDDRIEEMHNNINHMISDIQDKIKMEINYTKKEMEKEVVNKFMEAEQKQQKLMADKIEEQKKVIEKMNNTRGEIEKIRKHFEETNSKCERLGKENESLRINLQSLEEDNESLIKKLKFLKREYRQLVKEHKTIFKGEELENPFNIDLDEEDADNYDEGDDLIMMDLDNNSLDLNVEESGYIKGNTTPIGNNFKNLNLKNLSVSNSNVLLLNASEKNKTPMKFKTPKQKSPKQTQLQISSPNKDKHNPELIIQTLKENIKSVKNEYKYLHSNYIEEIRQRNEAQQLLQKCIEDVKFEINKIAKDISNFVKINQNSTNLLNKKFEEQLNAKQNNLLSLENKLKILTFVYDNGFQNTKSKKNKLLSSFKK